MLTLKREKFLGGCFGGFLVDCSPDLILFIEAEGMEGKKGGKE